MRPAVLLILVLIAGPAAAQLRPPTRALPEASGLHVGSWHDRDGYDDLNPGAFVRWDGGLTAGAYRNSESRTTCYLGFLNTIVRRRGVGLDLLMGAFSGYSESVPVIPLVVPGVRVRLARAASVELIYVPSLVMPGRVNVLHLMLEASLGSPARRPAADRIPTPDGVPHGAPPDRTD